MSQPIYRTSPVRAYATFADPTQNGAPVDVLDPLWLGSGSGFTLVDPTAVTISVLRADGSVFVTGAVALKKSTGRYYYDFTVDQEPVGTAIPQLWICRFAGTGPNAGVIEFSFPVQTSRF